MVGSHLLTGGLAVWLGLGAGGIDLPDRAAAVVVAPQGPEAVRRILADNERRRTANPEGYARKLAALAEHPFAFFRGTAPHFYRQLFARLPQALRAAPETVLHGDLHVENFAVVPADGGLTYGLDDFDESLPGPVSLDLIRCLTSLAVAFGEDAHLLAAYLDGYAQGLQGTARFESAAIGKALTKAAKSSQAKMLAKRTTATRPRRMVLNEKNQALSPEFKSRLAAAVAASGLAGLDGRPMQDAVQRFGGTASLDLFRYEAVFGDGSDRDQIVEVKELLPSVLSPYLGPAEDDWRRYRQGAAQYQGAHALPVAATTLGPYRFLVRYRPHYKDSLSASDVKTDDRLAFVRDLGRITGQGHARGSRQPADLAAFAARGESALVQVALDLARENQAAWQAFRAGR